MKRVHPEPVTPPKRKRTVVEHLPAISLAALTTMTVIAHLVPFDSAPSQWNNVAAIMLWLLLFLGWALAGVLRGNARMVFDRTTLLVLVLTLLPGVSAIAVGLTLSGNARLAANLGWQWASFGMLFFLARQWIRSSADARLVAALMIAIAVGLSVYALVDFAVIKPQSRAAYQADPEKVLLENNIIAPSGTPIRKHFEDRLASTEPTATFALTNSLAGLITPWLVLLVGLAVSTLSLAVGDRGEGVKPAPKASAYEKALNPNPLPQGEGSRQIWRFILPALLLAAVLVLTKSRTAVLATLGGLGLVVLYATPLGRRVDARILLAIGLVGVASVLGGVVSGALDVEVLSEAPKSVLYRFQYWQATSQLIREHAALGVGPGNFQDVYKHYQLPEASENIADPHNFVLEIWSTAGTPALVVLVLVALVFAMQLRKKPKAEEEQAPPSDALTAPLTAHALGALIGVVFGFACGFLADLMPATAVIYSAVPAGALTFWLLQPWIERGELKVSMLIAALVALLVNLLAAGGISFPGVATSVWLLAATALVTARPPRERELSRNASIAWLIATMVAGAMFYFSVYNPMLVGEALRAEMMVALQTGQFSKAAELADRATQVDSLSPDPWLHVANLCFSRLMEGEDTPKTRGEFQNACEQAVQRDPHSERLHTIVADWYLRLWRHSGDNQNLSDLGSAAEHYEAATKLFPNNAMVHAQLAWVYHLLARDEDAAREAATALELDSRHDHGEYKLKSEYNPGVFDPGPSPGKKQPAVPVQFRKQAERLKTEPLMQWLRKK